jgi:carboxymethylenebutenolidase
VSHSQDNLHARAIALYDQFTHVHHDRRAFMRDLTALAGGVVAAEALLAAIAPNAALAAQVAADESRLTVQTISLPAAEGRVLNGYLVMPAKARRRGVVLVVHENRGLNDHIRDVARRLALAGYIAFAADFLTSAGGTPGDEDAARTMIGKLDLAHAVADGAAAIRALKSYSGSNGRVGVVGFCWGGAMVNRLAVASGEDLAAGSAFYGPAPDPALAARVKARLQLHYAGNDPRVNGTADAWVQGLKAAGVAVERFDYSGTEHAFHNDTAVARYNPAAARLAWDRTLKLFAQTLR